MTALRQRILVYGGILGGLGAITGAAFFSEEWPYSLSVSLAPVKELNVGGTRAMVFRLSCAEGKRLNLTDPGLIEVPVDSTGPRPWRSGTLRSPTTCITSFAPVAFRRQVEFTIAAPTNRYWRLQVHAERTFRLMALKEQVQGEWNCLKNANWAGMPNAWSLPSKLVINYYAWSPDLTNGTSAH